jgi:hypothetical protein
MPDAKEVYEMVTKHKPPAPGALDRQHGRQVRVARHKRIGAYVVAATIGVAAIVLVVMTRPGRDASIPIDQPSVVTPDPAAVDVATRFVDAFGAHDGERAITYLSDTPLLEMDATTPDLVPVFTSWLEAMGYEQITVEPCSVTGATGAGTAVLCPFEWHGIRSAEIGFGPYPGSWELSVRDGEIVHAAFHWNIDRFGPQMWDPFRDWVTENHPKDFDVMYVSGGTNFRLTDESVRLWELRTAEYVRDVQR